MPTSNEILEVSVGFDGSQLVAGGTKVMGSLKKNANIATTAVDGLNYAIEDTSDVLKDTEDAVAGVAKGEKKRLEFVLTHTKKLADLEHRLLTANKTEKKDIEELQKIQEKNYKILTAKTSGYMKKLIAVREATEELRKSEESRKPQKAAKIAGFGIHDTGEEIGDSFKEAVSSMGSKDLMGVAGGFFKALGAAGKGARGGLMRAQGTAAAGEGGMATGAMAGASKMLEVVAKIGPIVMTLSSLLIGVVKIFLDADAAAKDFNKEILATSSHAGFLKKNMGMAGAATNDLKKTMGEMYDQATDLDNLNWGISKETHASIQAALGAQGVQLDKTQEYFDAVKSGRVQSQGMVKDWGSMSKMSVAYSRTFAVSIGEITDLQGEMMGELGMSFDSVQSGFQAMADGADDAGIASNKFFGQMRAISADMSLFNNRTEASAKLMAKLDQAMSPKKATEFFGTIQKFFKGMGTMDRAKVTLAAGGGATKNIEAKSLKSSVEGLSADFEGLEKGMGADFKQALGSKSALTKFMAKNGKKLSGEQKDAIMKAARLQTKVARGDTLSLASGLADIDPMSTIDELDAVAKTRFGKPMEDLNALEREGMKLYANVDDDMMDNLGNLKMAFDSSKEAIVQKLKDGEALTADEAKMMGKLGINFKNGQGDLEAATKLQGKDSKQVFNSMSKDQKDLLEGSKATIDYAKQQSELTQSQLDKLSVIMEFLMRQVYDTLIGIWEGISDILSSRLFKGAANDQALRKMEIQAAKTKDMRLVDAIHKAGGDANKAQGLMIESVGKDFMANVDTSQKRVAELAKAIKAEHDKKAGPDGKGGPDQKAITDMVLELRQLNKDMGEDWNSLRDGLDKNTVLGAQVLANAAKETTGENSVALAKASKLMAQTGASFDVALDKVGLPMQSMPDEIKKVLMGKMLWSKNTGESDTVAALSGLHMGKKGAAAGAPGASPVPSAQSGEAPKTSAQHATAPTPVAAAAAPPTPATAPGLQLPALPSDKPLSADDLQEATEKQGENIQSTMDDLATSLHRSSGGIVFNGPYLKGKFGNQMEASVYSAASRALFEYWMYQDVKKEDALKAVKSGVNPRDFGSSFLGIRKSEGINDDKSAVDKMTQMSASKSGPRAPGNAEGGVVGRPAPGEFLASVKPGEKIIPVGGGGGGATKVILELKGDMLKQIIRATTLNTLNEHDRAKTSR